MENNNNSIGETLKQHANFKKPLKITATIDNWRLYVKKIRHNFAKHKKMTTFYAKKKNTNYDLFVKNVQNSVDLSTQFKQSQNVIKADKWD